MSIKKSLLILIILFFGSSLWSQHRAKKVYIPDKHFTWENYPSCKRLHPLYKKAERDPIISNKSIAEFEQTVTSIIENSNLSKKEHGVLKLILLFAKDQSVCIQKMGSKDILLDKATSVHLVNMLENDLEIVPPSNQGQNVNSIGYLYIEVENGLVKSIQRKNFDLNDDI